VGLGDSPACIRCKQVFETASDVLFDYEDVMVFRFKHLGQHFLNPDAFEDISIGNYLIKCM
jgi:hypothetical protein